MGQDAIDDSKFKLSLSYGAWEGTENEDEQLALSDARAQCLFFLRCCPLSCLACFIIVFYASFSALCFVSHLMAECSSRMSNCCRHFIRGRDQKSPSPGLGSVTLRSATCTSPRIGSGQFSSALFFFEFIRCTVEVVVDPPCQRPMKLNTILIGIVWTSLMNYQVDHTLWGLWHGER